MKPKESLYGNAVSSHTTPRCC